MSSTALEEKINKIRLQNEAIRRRYEEVEADKKNAAKSNALVQLVPSDDWPERKEPPEFSSPPKNPQRSKVQNKEHVERPSQHFPGSIQERLERKGHKFATGDGPPPDPKYNFLADSEREMNSNDDGQTNDEKNKSKNKGQRGGRGKRGGMGAGRGIGGVNESGGSREAFFKDNRGPHAFHSREDSLPEYEAWRAERNRIDEARINRQKTAEGNWRREWDNNKVPVEKDNARKEFIRKDSNNFERRNNHYENDYSNRGHGGSRTYHGLQKTYGNQDFRRPTMHQEQTPDYKRQPESKTPLSPTDDRTVTAFDQSIKVTVNHGNQSAGTLMSVKVNSPSIAGTGRVGPRQKSRITYSSQSDTQEINTFSRQKSFDEKTAATKSPYTPRKKEGNPKSPFPTKKEFRNDESTKNRTKALHSQRNESRDQRQSDKPQRVQKRITKNDFSDDNAIPSEYNPDKLYRSNQNSVNANDNNEGFSDPLLISADESSSNVENSNEVSNDIDESYVHAYKDNGKVDEIIERIDVHNVEYFESIDDNHESAETDVSEQKEMLSSQQSEVIPVNQDNTSDEVYEKVEGMSIPEEESQIPISEDKNDDDSVKMTENNDPTVNETSSSNADNHENDNKNIQYKDFVTVPEKIEESHNESVNINPAETDSKIDEIPDNAEEIKLFECDTIQINDKEINPAETDSKIDEIPDNAEEIKLFECDTIQINDEEINPAETDSKIDEIPDNAEEIKSLECDMIQINDVEIKPVEDKIEKSTKTDVIQELDEIIVLVKGAVKNHVQPDINQEKLQPVENFIPVNDTKIEEKLLLSKNADDSGYTENSILDDSQEVEKKPLESKDSVDKSNLKIDCNDNDSQELKGINSIDATKEISEKTVEICDIHSAASEAMGDEKLQNPTTKDNSDESTI